MGTYPVFQEYSHFGIAQALLAGQMGVSFLPIRSQAGSDMLKYNPEIKVIDDPYAGGKIGAVGAIVPDVGIIHVQRCDENGNAQRYGSLGVDAEGINASRTVIITTEKIVDSDVIRRDPNRTIIPGYRVAAVVEQPWGAFPMHLAGCYSSVMGLPLCALQRALHTLGVRSARLPAECLQCEDSPCRNRLETEIGQE